MKIAIKTQTTRSTQYKEGFNCVNLFLKEPNERQSFELGLRVTEWGDKKEIEPLITISIEDKEYLIPINKFIKMIKEAMWQV
jgi:hypothetical protein